MISAETALTIMAIIGGSIATGIGSAALYFKAQRKGITDDIENATRPIRTELSSIRGEMRERLKEQHENDVEIRALQEKSVNNVRRLDEIYKSSQDISKEVKASAQETNRKIDTISETLGKALRVFYAGNKHED